MGRSFGDSPTLEDTECMELALHYAEKSHDPRTKCGAVLTDLDGKFILGAYNTFPIGIRQSEERWQRPLKYAYVEHAERNAIFLAARKGVNLLGSNLYCTVAPCVECARAIIQAGVRTVTHLPLEGGITHGKWVGSVAIANELMKEVNVKVDIVESVNVHT